MRTRYRALAWLGLVALTTGQACRYGFEILDDVTNGESPMNGGSSVGGMGGVPLSNGGGDGGASTSAGGSGSDGGLGGAPGGAGGEPAVEPIVHCAEIRPLPSAPVLDGEMDGGMFLEELIPAAWNSPDPGGLPPGHSTKFSVGWRPNGLYFFVEVTDPDRNPAPDGERPWVGDGFEIYVDHDASFDTPPQGFDEFGTRQFMMSAPADDVTPSTRGNIRVRPSVYEDWETDGWVSLPTPTGYVLEAFIEAEQLGLASWTLMSGGVVAFDLAHNVSYEVGTTGMDQNRLGQYFLRVLDPPNGNVDDFPFNNEAAFCSATLL